MALSWFLAGSLTALAVVIVLLPWLRSLPPLPGFARAAAVVVILAVLGTTRWMGTAGTGTAGPGMAGPGSAVAGGPAVGTGTPNPAAAAGPATPSGMDSSGSAFGTAAKVFGAASGSALPGGGGASAAPAGKAGAGSMDAAIASLESRLAKGGGSPDDWELLAKSFEFLGRPADAAKARAHQLAPLSGATAATAASGSAATAKGAAGGGSVSVTGEVALAPALASKASAGETLFIVAKSVDSPGIPVAVFRGSVGSWPLKFSLDDSQSMMPGRTLSTAGRVTIEARISPKGQPLPSSGDLQGSTGPINPADRTPLKITIDRVIS